MKFIIADNYDEMSKIGANLILAQIKSKHNSVLGLATGSTPLGMYRYLADAYNNGFDFSSVISFNLDEYCGLTSEHPQSYRYFMDTNFFNLININKKNIHIPDGSSSDIENECLKYDEAITRCGNIDLQVLGIGRNGHIGFNEPDDALQVRSHITGLSQDTIKANSRFFNSMEEVPKFAITIGLGTIMKAKKIILLASGIDKAPVIAKIALPYVDTSVPASILQLHNNCIIIADKDAASIMEAASEVAV